MTLGQSACVRAADGAPRHAPATPPPRLPVQAPGGWDPAEEPTAGAAQWACPARTARRSGSWAGLRALTSEGIFDCD